MSCRCALGSYQREDLGGSPSSSGVEWSGVQIRCWQTQQLVPLGGLGHTLMVGKVLKILRKNETVRKFPVVRKFPLNPENRKVLYLERGTPIDF